jgi:hypothetical protein
MPAGVLTKRRTILILYESATVIPAITYRLLNSIELEPDLTRTPEIKPFDIIHR